MFIKVAVIYMICLSVSARETLRNHFTLPYDPDELLSRIFSGNSTQTRALIKFENQFESDYVSLDDQDQTPTNTKPFKFEDHVQNYDEVRDDNIRFDDSHQDGGNGHTGYGFLNENTNGNTNVRNDYPNQAAENNNSGGYGLQTGNKPNGYKKKRRRRKPKKFPGQPGYLNPGYPGPIGPGPAPVQNFGPNSQTGFNGQFNRPNRRPRPSFTSDALSAVTGALTSIAENDDYQCVARLICEAAAGGALGGSSLLDSVSGLQPLLTLLSAYNGISSNPLFVFGRATFLGMSSKNNPGSCRYAYPLCPTDPEQLVHYLNNHNGGFFRFFNSPQQGQQNLQQFYNQLSQNYGLYQPNPDPNQGHYGLLNPGQVPNYPQPNLYPNGNGYQQNYGLAYPYNQNYNSGIRFRNDQELIRDDNEEFNGRRYKIEKRIQNKPAGFLNDNTYDHGSKWLFPGEDDDNNAYSDVGIQYINYDNFKTNDDRRGNTLRFPETPSTYNNYNTEHENSRKPEEETYRKPKGISFPGSQNNNNHYNNYYTEYPTSNTDNNFVFNYVKRGVGYSNHYQYNNYNNNVNKDESGVTTVYVVRGNGDPNNPEIVKLRPGETLWTNRVVL